MPSRELWAACYARIVATWPMTDWPAETLQAYYEVLAPFTAEDLDRAVRSLATTLERAPALSVLYEQVRGVRDARMRSVERLGGGPISIGTEVVQHMRNAVRAMWRDEVSDILTRLPDEAQGACLLAARRRFVTMFGERDWYDDEVAEQVHRRSITGTLVSDRETTTTGET